MKHYLIRPDILLKFMGEDSYDKFIKELKERNDIPENESIFIIAEWSE